MDGCPRFSLYRLEPLRRADVEQFARGSLGHLPRRLWGRPLMAGLTVEFLAEGSGAPTEARVLAHAWSRLRRQALEAGVTADEVDALVPPIEARLTALRRAAGIDAAFERGWWQGVPDCSAQASGGCAVGAARRRPLRRRYQHANAHADAAAPHWPQLGTSGSARASMLAPQPAVWV